MFYHQGREGGKDRRREGEKEGRGGGRREGRRKEGEWRDTITLLWHLWVHSDPLPPLTPSNFTLKSRPTHTCTWEPSCEMVHARYWLRSSFGMGSRLHAISRARIRLAYKVRGVCREERQWRTKPQKMLTLQIRWRRGLKTKQTKHEPNSAASTKPRGP